MTEMESLTNEVINGRMTLQEVSNKIDTYLSELEAKLLDDLKKTQQEIEETTQELNKAIAMGDLSENAEFSAAVKQLKELRIAYVTINTRLNAIGSNRKKSNYQHIGLIVVGTTVQLHDEVNNIDYVFKLFPENISDVNNGIIDSLSRIGKAIFRKEKGQTVIVEDHMTGFLITYRIVDLY